MKSGSARLLLHCSLNWPYSFLRELDGSSTLLANDLIDCKSISKNRFRRRRKSETKSVRGLDWHAWIARTSVTRKIGLLLNSPLRETDRKKSDNDFLRQQSILVDPCAHGAWHPQMTQRRNNLPEQLPLSDLLEFLRRVSAHFSIMATSACRLNTSVALLDRASLNTCRHVLNQISI